MYHYYLDKGIPLSELEALSANQRYFMLASMLLAGEEANNGK